MYNMRIMTKRSYHSYCPIAYALDIIGERWTLLIIRELQFGPRRFTDLLTGLPGIGPNLLSQRLKDLEQADIIGRNKLPPPAATIVYGLTGVGQSLVETVLTALNTWGRQFFPLDPPEDDACTIIPIMHGLEVIFRADQAQDMSMTAQVHADQEVFYVDIEAGQVEVGLGLAENPDLIIDVDLRVFSQLMTGRAQVSKALAGGAVEIRAGSQAQFETLMSLFKLTGVL